MVLKKPLSRPELSVLIRWMTTDFFPDSAFKHCPKFITNPAGKVIALRQALLEVSQILFKIITCLGKSADQQDQEIIMIQHFHDQVVRCPERQNPPYEQGD